MDDWARADSKRVLITGRTGSGKSSLMLWWVCTSYKSYYKVLVFDINGEFFQRLIKTKALEDVQLLDNLGKMVDDKSPIVCYEPPDSELPAVPFDHFCWWCFELAKASPKPVLMVIDELQTYVNSYGAPASFLTCLLRGRKYGLDMLLASQQANIIHNTIRSSVSDVIAFGQGDIQAVKYVERFGIFGVHQLKQTEFFWHKVGTDKPEKHQLVFKDGGAIVEIKKV